MKYKRETYRFVNDKPVRELIEEEIEPIFYLNDYYNFLDTERFESAYGHSKGSKNYIYEVLKKHLEALEIIKKKGLSYMEVSGIKACNDYESYKFEMNHIYTSDYERKKAMKTREEYDLLKEVLL